jgi:histone-lysine N-methyltransferase SETMAR
MSVDDDKRSGRPSTGTTTENVEKVLEAILEDRRRTIHDVCDIFKLSYGTCQRILSDELKMRRIPAKFVPRLLRNDQMKHRVAVCSELKEIEAQGATF